MLIACVEFDSIEQNLLAAIYGQLYSDIPTGIRNIDVFNIEDLTDEQIESIYLWKKDNWIGNGDIRR